MILVSGAETFISSPTALHMLCTAAAGATSVGMTMRVLQSCAAYTTGTSVVFIVPPNTAGGRGLFGPSSTHTTKGQ